MSQARVSQAPGTGYVTLRRGNQRSEVSFWADRARLYFVFAATAVLVAFALLFVWVNHQSVEVGYAISTATGEKAELIETNRKYRVELANLTALQRLEQMAKKDLKLAPPTAHQVQVIE
jgi:cell division protein FtsL